MNSKVHPRVRSFMWRFCNNALPIKDKLFLKHCMDDAQCGIYGVSMESLSHVFMHCSRVRGVEMVLVMAGGSAWDWYFNVFRSQGNEVGAPFMEYMVGQERLCF